MQQPQQGRAKIKPVLIILSCHEPRNAIFLLRDVLNRMCLEINWFLFTQICVLSAWLSLPPERCAPSLTRNLIRLHVLRAVQREHMPYCVLQGCHGLSLQCVTLSRQGQAAGHHVCACISMPYKCKDRCSQCLRKGTWGYIRAPWQHIRPKAWIPIQLAAESQITQRHMEGIVQRSVCVCANMPAPYVMGMCKNAGMHNETWSELSNSQFQAISHEWKPHFEQRCRWGSTAAWRFYVQM